MLRGGGHRVGGAVGEIVAGDDLVAGAEAAAQGRIVVVDAGIDDGDGHAGAVDFVRRSSGGRAGDRVVGGRGAGFDRAGGLLDYSGGGRTATPLCARDFRAVSPAGDGGDARRRRGDGRPPAWPQCSIDWIAPPVESRQRSSRSSSSGLRRNRARWCFFPVHPMRRVSPDGRQAIGIGRPANQL